MKEPQHEKNISWRRMTAVILAAAFLTLAAYALYVVGMGNFHVITPGEAYRSAQLDREEFTRYIRLYHIKSIINLRGSRPGFPWYDEELAVSRELGVTHYDVDFPSIHDPSEEERRQLTDYLLTAPRPVLIHCAQGADRSGLAAAMWKVLIEKKTKAEAARQLSLWYGHMPFGDTQAMDRYFEKWNP